MNCSIRAKAPGQTGTVQPDTGGAGGVAVGGAPFAPFRALKLGGGKPLQRFRAGVVVQIIGGKAADARFVKGFAGSGKAGVIGGTAGYRIPQKDRG